MFRTFADMCDAGDVDLAAIGREQVAFWSRAVAEASRTLRERPSTTVAHVAYDDLVRDPVAAVTAVYATLGRTVSPDFERAMRRHLADDATRRAATKDRLRAFHAYSLAEYAIDEADVEARFRDYYAAHLRAPVA